MKIKNLLLTLALAGACTSQASAQSFPHSQPNAPSSVRHIGDGVRSIGDTGRSVALSDDTRPAAFKSNAASGTVSHQHAESMSILAPTSYQTGCSSGFCGGSCGSAACSTSNRSWASFETLLWFSQGQDSPSLVTTSEPGTLPISGTAGVTDQFGGADGIDTGLLPGYRLTFGHYLDDCRKLGVVGRVFGIYSSSEEFAQSSDGSTSIGVPYFNALTQASDAYLVAYSNDIGDPTQLVSEGSVSARADLDMIGADGSFSMLLGRSGDHRVDLLAGYTFNRLKSSAGVSSVSTNRFTGDLIPDGTVFAINDMFETENEFHGAHLGLLSTIVRDRLSISTMGKVSFGNMHQMVRVSGSTQEEFNGAVTAYEGGILALPSNIGSVTQDEFAFIPELGVNMGYCLRENLKLNVGYTFMLWSSVAIAGEQIDNTVNLTQSQNGPAASRPASMFNDTSFWMQGVDLGATWTF